MNTQAIELPHAVEGPGRPETDEEWAERMIEETRLARFRVEPSRAAAARRGAEAGFWAMRKKYGTGGELRVFEIRFLEPKTQPFQRIAFLTFQTHLGLLSRELAKDSGLFCEVVKRSIPETAPEGGRS